jgi:hypothetical protein
MQVINKAHPHEETMVKRSMIKASRLHQSYLSLTTATRKKAAHKKRKGDQIAGSVTKAQMQMVTYICSLLLLVIYIHIRYVHNCALFDEEQT